MSGVELLHIICILLNKHFKIIGHIFPRAGMQISKKSWSGVEADQILWKKAESMDVD